MVSKKSVNGILMIQIFFIACFRDFDKGGNWQNEFLKILSCGAIDHYLNVAILDGMGAVSKNSISCLSKDGLYRPVHPSTI